MKKNILAMVLGLSIGLVAGFMFANSYNRGGARSGSVTSPAEVPGQSVEAALSPEEIKAKIAEADNSPGDVAFQKNLGTALYAYGASKEDAALILESIRLLNRVVDKDPKDRETLIALGNANFDVAYFRKESTGFEQARAFYIRALEVQGEDPSVLVDIGLTFALTAPPDYKSAAQYYDSALKYDPNHERTLQMMTDAQIKMGDMKKASTFLERLKAVKASNPMIPDFERTIGSRP